MKVAGIDVHKKVLMVVVVDSSAPEEKPARRRFVTLPSELQRFRIWLQAQGVEEAVMESTAQYWRSVWLELEPHMRLHLAQAFSNRAPRGRKHDFKDGERLVRRLIADELILSFVPNGEQRIWRSLTRMKVQLTRDRVRLQNQMECLLEEMRIKLSIVVSNLLGASGLRILHALAQGETDPKKLAELGDERLHCTEEQLVDALTGRVQPMHRGMLALQLQDSLKFSPTVAGSRSANLTIVDNSSTSPHVIPLTGTGVTAAPSVSVSPSSLTFGSQLVGGTSAGQTITITNTGTATLNISSVSISGDFQVH
jgi:transposase